MKILITLGSAAALALAGASAFSTGTEPQPEVTGHDHSATAPVKVDAPSIGGQMKLMQMMMDRESGKVGDAHAHEKPGK